MTAHRAGPGHWRQHCNCLTNACVTLADNLALHHEMGPPDMAAMFDDAWDYTPTLRISYSVLYITGTSTEVLFT